MSNKIKDITEFCRLFRVRIPIEKEFDFYIDTLMRSPEYAWLEERLQQFAELEEWLDGDEVGGFKMDQLNYLKRIISDSRTYYDFSRYDVGVPRGRKDMLNQHTGRYLLSIDILQANYSIFRSFDRYREFPLDWDTLCKEERIHPLLAASKAWRQLLFGNLYPKRNQRFQHIFVESFIDLLRPLGLRDDMLLTISHDEATIVLGDTPEEAAQTYQAVKLMADMVAGPDCSEAIPEPFAGQLDLGLRPFRLENLGRGSYIRERFTIEEGEFKFSHKTLYGVPGNQFFMQFRKHVLEEEYDERDLMFMNDHKLAKWVV